MANVLNRITKELLNSVNTPDFPTGDWIVNPDLSAVAGQPVKYWKIVGDSIQFMNSGERDVVDAALLPAAKKLENKRASAAVANYLDTRYPRELRDALTQPHLGSLTVPQVAAVAAYSIWLATVNDGFKSHLEAVGATATLAELEALTLSFAAFDGTDPNVSTAVLSAVAAATPSSVLISPMKNQTGQIVRFENGNRKTLVDATPIIGMNANLNNAFRLVLEGARTLAKPVNPLAGRKITILVQMGAGGPFVLTLEGGAGGFLFAAALASDGVTQAVFDARLAATPIDSLVQFGAEYDDVVDRWLVNSVSGHWAV